MGTLELVLASKELQSLMAVEVGLWVRSERGL